MPLFLPLPIAFAVERALRLLLEHDPDAHARLARIDGRVVRLHVTRPAVEVSLAVVDGRIDVLRTFDGEADVTITGSLAALRSLQRSNDALYGGEVRVEGDIGVAKGLSDVIGGLDLDLEELVAPFLGGTLARRVGLAGRDARAWFGRTRESFRVNAEEYLKEETELLAPADEIVRWNADVDELRAAADRLAARVARLERQRSDHGQDGSRAGSGA